MPRIRIPGLRTTINLESSFLNEYLSEIDSFEIQEPIRGATQIESYEMDESSIVYYQFDDGSTLFISYDELCSLSHEERKTLKGSRNASIIDENDLLLPVFMPNQGSERGIFRRFFPKVVAFLKKQTTDKIMGAIGDQTTKAIVDHLQNNLVAKEGLFIIDKNFELQELPDTFSRDATYFLFIHGTNSNTTNAFSGIKNQNGGHVWKQINQKYKERLLAFEHHTMTKSPLENTLKLVSDLPDEISTVIMTHSRGGLVMDTLLMALECSKDAEKKNKLFKFFREFEREKDEEIFKELLDMLSRKDIKIEQSIKVACPGYGTNLLSDNLTNFFRVFSASIKYAFPAASLTIGSLVEKLVLSVIKNKDEVDVLPGIEAMTPDSPFLKIINGFEQSQAHNQFIMAGRARLTGNIIHSLKFIFTRIIIQERSDMVVHTQSMHQGLRNPNGYKYFLAEGRTVHHSSYFVDDFTQEKILQAIESEGMLISDTIDISFESAPDTRGLGGIERGEILPGKISGTKPVIILLPGIMGSTLYLGDDRYWINFRRLVWGPLEKLDIHEPNIRPIGLIRTVYRRFRNYFVRQGYDVYLYPFDWRKSLNETAKAFNKAVKKDLLEKYPQLSLQVISHSMGGVLFRTFINNFRDTYDQLSQRNNFKWIMAGTPWYGSYTSLETMVGKGDRIKLLSKISIARSKLGLLSIFIKYPGFLELLPTNFNNGITDKDVTDPDFWKDLNQADRDGTDWVIPDPEELKKLKEYFTQVRNFKIKDPEKVYYIAGGGGRKNKKTPRNFSIENGELNFDEIHEGDTTVTWKEGIPEELKANNHVYFVRTRHTQMLNDPKLFPGIKDLLRTGSAPFSTVGESILRGEGVNLVPIYTSEDYFVNNADELEELLFDYEDEQEFLQTPLIKVKITHGDLKYAQGPLMVGHFAGEYIIKAHSALDNALGGLLKQRFDKGVYPEAAGSSLFILKQERNQPQGALVIGIGNPFEFTGFKLTSAVRTGIVKAILQVKENQRPDAESFIPDTISSLLIGTAYGGISMENSIRSIIEGVKLANMDLFGESDWGAYENTIKKIEFIELYEDKAIAAFYILKKLHQDGTIENCQLTLNQNTGSRSNLSVTYGSDNWNQLTIRQSSPCPMTMKSCFANRNRLIFSLNTGMAREDTKEIYIDHNLIHHFLWEIAREDHNIRNWDKETAKVLFERLIPQDFKNSLRLQQNTVLNLDEATSVYPWELIQDTKVNEKPWCVSTGLIRTLNLSRPVANRNYSKGNHILVIGDPLLNSGKYDQLPGAAKEAEEVKNIFSSNNFDFDLLINRDARDVFSSIYARDHRFIHIAAHGEFDPTDSFKSGIVIGSIKNGDNEELMLITAADITQLDSLPEMVFINTCYSGKNTTEALELSYRTYEFAANIGTEFISRGVRSVIVAGWPVYDDLALLFAKTFYQAMFAGDEFGVAVQKARSRCYEASPDRNTWGAYQCYGDPMYKMNFGKPSFSNFHSTNATKEYFLPQEIKNDLNNVISKAGNSKSKESWLKAELLNLSSAIQRLKIESPDILEAQAMAYYALGDNKLALTILEKVLASEKAGFSVRTLEQWCNIRAKSLIAELQNSDNSTKKSADFNAYESEFDDIMEKLESLLQFGETSERYSIMGSTMKRKAMAQEILGRTKNTVKSSLRKSLKYYQAAQERRKEKIEMYNQVVILQLQLILNNEGNHKNTLRKLRHNFKPPKNGGNYYEQIATFNFYVTEYLISEKIADAGAIPVDKFLKGEFDRIWNDYGSYNQLKGEYEHLENLIAGLTKNDARIKVLEIVAEHIRHIEKTN